MDIHFGEDWSLWFGLQPANDVARVAVAVDEALREPVPEPEEEDSEDI